MPIDTSRSEYFQHSRQAERCRDALAGSDAVKNKGPRYLPSLSGQTADQYDAYKMRALWYGAAARTIQGLTGAVMRKDPVVTVPTELGGLISDVTQTGIPFSAFAKTTLEEVLVTGRYGVLVDMSEKPVDNPKAYFAGYRTESIVNWRTAMIHGVPSLVLLVLREHCSEPKAEDPYTLESIEQYRVLRINGEGHYEAELFRKEGNEWKSIQLITPTHRGTPFTYIPFCFFGPNTLTPDIEKSPILDLVDVNFSHFRSSADLEHGRHFCGLPTPWVAGFPETTVLKIGSSTAWVSSDPNASAGMLEFTGQGLGALEKALESKERLMAVLGARMLEEQKKTVEASDTLSTRMSGEQSVLRSVAGTVSAGLSKCLEWAALWMGVGPDEAKKAAAKLNTDFMDTAMSFVEMEALVRTWQAGGLSWATYYHLLERGEVTRPGIDAETEKALIEQDGPLLPSLGQEPNG